MDLEYDRKFEEMKKYIPFLESMIKRLESTSSASSNPRQAQLDKIRSLRDLLLDKKKRMKMENLLKCEQVLVNLYAKVEQRDALPNKAADSKKEDKDLEAVRNKLKSVTTNPVIIDSKEDTLPEISRASEIEEVCTPGSKEPALFQRRPNKLSPNRSVPKSPNKTASQTLHKKSYTRVLVSPEPSSRRWMANEESNVDIQVYTRRSPNRRYSSSRERKKEKKKGKQEKSKKSKGLNITLNVPEDSLASLNTKDILSRIMNCNDSDMDIETLREAKRQILSELQQTGAKYDDISDLLLKSYNKKSGDKKNNEVEEGELSDSESEAIESIYGGLSNSQGASSSSNKPSAEKEQPRKIQICLLLNPEDGKESESGTPSDTTKQPPETDTSDFQMYGEKTIITDTKQVSKDETDHSDLIKDLQDDEEQTKPESVDKESKCDTEGINPKPANFYKPLKEQTVEEPKSVVEKQSPDVVKAIDTSDNKVLLSTQNSKPVSNADTQESIDPSSETKDVEIPLLHETVPTVKQTERKVSEIDILQALKNEILSESISIPGSDTVTPALHQPKFSKVASAQEILPKKRISIEKYKEKAELKPKPTTPLFIMDPLSPKDDMSKKQSLKLTMKECERFNFPVKLALDDDSSEEEDSKKVSFDDIYSDIAPKSPDFDNSSDVLNSTPVIIPVDPIKNTGIVIASKEDVDMRTFPLLQPNITPKPNLSPVVSRDAMGGREMTKQKEIHMNTDMTKVPSDPRMRRDLSQSGNIEGNPFPLMINNERPLHSVPPPGLFPNMTPTITPNMTPLRNPNMTPSMTPNSRSFEIDESASKKHVYTPMFTPFDPREREASVAKETIPSYKPEIDNNTRRVRWDPPDPREVNHGRKWDDRDPRSSSMQRDARDIKYNKNTRFSIDRREMLNRTEHPQTPVHPFGRSDGPSGHAPNPFGLPSLLDLPMTPAHSFGRSDCPTTPSHPFGRSECPPTPGHPFGRSDCPPTPIHPFGRNDCPTTPSHPFGRSDCPNTPSHPFGRAECPTTPSHPFGRGDMPMTPNPSFGRSDNVPRDPRLNRSSDYDNYQKNDRERGGYYRDRNPSHTGYKPDVHNKSYDGPDSYRRHRERSVGRNENPNDRYNYSSRDRGGQYNREHISRREPSVGRGGRAMSRENDNDRLYSRERNYGNKSGSEHFNRNDYSRQRNNDSAPRKGFYRERSVGRSAPDEMPYRSTSRARSVTRTDLCEEVSNTLSVTPDAGRSFTIDTSVNSTFQDFLASGKNIQVFDYSFDKRRQRASSVGRSLVRESNIGRTLPPKPRCAKEGNTKKSEFRRASSVGRDVVSKDERSFRDIKADFEQFKSRIQMNKESEKTSVIKKDTRDVSDRKSRKDDFDKKIAESTSNKPYSPRKNIRDPRFRREPSDGNKTKSDDRNRKHAGIDYSHDNITKGTILGSGYGVKNYKIPKIKRVVEKEPTPEKVPSEKKEVAKTDAPKKTYSKKNEIDKKGGDKGSDKKVVPQKKDVEIKAVSEKPTEENKDGNIKTNKNKQLIETVLDKKSKEKVSKKSMDTPLLQNVKIVENVEKRVTRLSRKSETKPANKAKTYKKVVIYDSDSEEENSKDSDQNLTSVLSNKDIPKVLNNISTDENTLDSQPSEQMDSSFGIEDLEMFSDNIVSDPVIDNINELIADLDDELGPAKIVTPTEFSNDMIENMLESINNPGREDTKSLNEDEKLNDISEVINNDLNESGTSLDNMNVEKVSSATNIMATTNDITKNVVTHENSTVNCSKDGKMIQVKEDPKLKPKEDIKEEQSSKLKDHLVSKNISNNENVVTTTLDTEKAQGADKVDETRGEQSDVDACSTPDSTINSNEIDQDKLSQDSIPDSTNEVHNELNSIVSSTHDPVETSQKDNSEQSSSNKEATPAMDSIGSILSLLQSKTKIKELLSFLGDQASDNDKIKKKLEKLSEIVSDEEDDKKDNVDKTEVTPKDNDEKDKIIIAEKEETKSKDNTNANSLDDMVTEVTSENKDVEEPNINEKCANSEQATENKEKLDEETEIAEAEKVEDEVDHVEDTFEQNTPTKRMPPKRRMTRKGKFKKNGPKPVTRVTRSNIDTTKTKKKKQSRELKQLQDSIKEMFMKDEILNASGIRMCRLAKLVDEKKDQENSASSPAPMVVIEKAKEIEALEESLLTVKTGKKKIKPKAKSKVPELEKTPEVIKTPKYKPGPKSKTKLAQKVDHDDPYEFESDSVSDITNDKSIDDKEDDGSSSDSESLASSKSFGSSEVLSDLKRKPKRKRGRWQSGVIKPRKKKKVDPKATVEAKPTEPLLNNDIPIPKNPIIIPDMNCFTDKSYCFRKNVTTYSCRLCVYSGDDIVAHYKQQHPHSEIPLSRMHPQIAKEAIEQCEEINFQAISKIPTDKYVCRFCYKEFIRNKKTVLESFFWHIVSMHTGEYKKICSECVNVTKCPFNLDIPPPPKDVKGQLIGYICEKCNFTQISLENLKTHVIVRHNDEQTEVYTINLAVMSKQQLTKMLNTLVKQDDTIADKPRVLRSTRSNQSMTEASDEPSEDVTDSDHTLESPADRSKRGRKKAVPNPTEISAKTSFHTQIIYENDDNLSEGSHAIDNLTTIKVEKDFGEEKNEELSQDKTEEPNTIDTPVTEETSGADGSDIFDYPHFKIRYSDAGLKEYVCCINGKDSHYKTNLLISMKKHIQMKHKELWDGYCFVCKVIVTPQGHKHDFKECLQHFLDKHMDNFPVLEKPLVEKQPETPVEEPISKPYINVRPLSELISNQVPETTEAEPSSPILPKIESIVSLGASAEPVEIPIVYPPLAAEPEEIPFKYEEVQAEVMSKKHQVVLESMMKREKLLNVYKCAGRYCSFTSDHLDDALVHASTHTRVGGEGSLSCAYCNFDCSENAIDLVMHVFKSHGACAFACGHCFYRAAAGQLVLSHAAKAHPGVKAKVLSSTAAPPTTAPEHAMLPRDAAVQYYVCAHACKYRTYTAQKFCEHIQQRHAKETWHTCYICSDSVGSAAELVVHMRSHELDVYQCTWCVHGADSEARLLAHAAAAHPARQPQAYLRLITTKDGSKEFRVLPLATFNKAKIDVEKVSPSSSKDNPVREAERSIDLEKLIGSTSQMINAMATSSSEIQPQETSPEPEPAAPPVEEPKETPEVEPPLQTQPPRLETPPPMSVEERSQMPTPKLKTEPKDETEKQNEDVIYCLDSDDEDSRQTLPEPGPSVIDLSEEGAAQKTVKPAVTYEMIPAEKLFKCPVCSSTFKNIAGFKRHTQSCFNSLTDPAPCAHCRLITCNRDELVSHYTLEHSTADIIKCGVCNAKFYSIGNAKKHLKDVHKMSKVVVVGDPNVAGQVCKVMPMITPPKAGPPKRKLSGSVGEPPAKMKKYGPQDVDSLPINPILEELVHCSLCEFNTKVRLNMVRHLQFHAKQQPVPHTAPVNPVPHLETNEMHFDRMLNLASSSHGPRPDRAQPRPRPVPARLRHACGAPGCAYLSVDDDLFQRHWTTLHARADRFTCAHCALVIPLARPADFPRVMLHLRMHGANLYACPVCPFHHFRKAVVEKHCEESHAGARVVVVREEAEAPPPTGPPAPTMDLKPWQCGLCEFKSLLRQEIVEHCGRAHQSKMQYKCPACPFRTSTHENVRKHMTNSHPGKGGDVFYYFYREGSVPDEDGAPRWQRQRQRAAGPDSAEIKTEVADPGPALGRLPAAPPPAAAPNNPINLEVDLNIVKMEVGDASPGSEGSIEALCAKYGQFCDPNGLNYKCPLCQVITEDTREAMQSHLYEELGYRRWVCATCSYRAFHSAGMNEHITSEHPGQNQSPNQLPIDQSIEQWVTALLTHQTDAITKNKESLAKQKILTERPKSKPEEPPKPQTQAEPKTKATMAELEKAFGPLGVPSNMVFSCPKCNTKIKDERAMRDHLESELTKIRWCCSQCGGTFQTYHAALLHCQAAHAGLAAHPAEAERSPALRRAWLRAVLQVQKLSMRCLPLGAPPPEPDNSLLVVRYETRVPTPEAAPAPAALAPRVVCLACEEALPETQSKAHRHPDAVATFVKLGRQVPRCGVCEALFPEMTYFRDHFAASHPGRKLDYQMYKPGQQPRVVCLACEKALPEPQSRTHRHSNGPPEFARVGESVFKCSVCAALRLELAGMREHFAASHPGETLNYTSYRPGGRRASDDDVSPPAKRIAKKSTAKPPVQAVAGRSSGGPTEADEAGAFSFYGSRSTLDSPDVSSVISLGDTVPYSVENSRVDDEKGRDEGDS